jgi:hypothetical protein
MIAILLVVRDPAPPTKLQLTSFKHPSFCKLGPDYGLIKKAETIVVLK